MKRVSSVYFVVYFDKSFPLKDPVFEFEKKRNEPLIYDRELWTKTGIDI